MVYCNAKTFTLNVFALLVFYKADFNMVTIRDIAERYGVSVATVSKALNNQKDIGAKTKEEIRKLAKEMGYAPNAAAKELKTNKTHNLGVLFVDEGHSGLTHDYFNHVLDSFKNTAELKGYNMTFINCCKESENRYTYLEQARSRGFDGIVIACVDYNDPEVVELMKSDIPVVTIDYVFNEKINVISDNNSGMRDLVKYVYSKGHRKIAYIHGEGTIVTRGRLTSFRKTCEELGISVPKEYIKASSFRDVEGAYKETLELLSLKNPPTCILYPDDFSSFGGINAIYEKGLKIPEDISVAGYDGIALAKCFRPQITTIVQDTKRIGEQAAKKLISQIEKPETTLIEMVIVPGKVFEGSSVAEA